MECSNSEIITKYSIEIILKQMTDSICLIKNKNGNYQIGFFIYFINKNIKIPTLMTKYDIIEQYKENILNVYYKNKNKIIKLGMKLYLNKEYDLSIIEIIEDKTDNIKYLEIDNNIFNKELETNYSKSSMYIIQYNNKKDLSISFGRIKGIIKSKITYSCYTNSHSKGLLIFNLSNNKIIGIHLENFNFCNKGILLKDIAKLIFKDQKYKNEENEIYLLINIEENDIKKRIYFLDNYDDDHNNLKQLDESNTELFINNNKIKYKKYFKPENEGKYKIKLKFKLYLKDCAYMFAGCKNIIKFNLINFKTKNVEDMRYMLYNCNMKDIDLFSFNTKNVKYMNYMFGFCKNLNGLNISLFDVKNVIDMSGLFKGCSSLKKLSDISKWNTKNINNMSYLFFGCSSILELPDISNWNMENVINMSYFFDDCSSLKLLPDISKWNIKSVTDISGIFKGCILLKSLPDISKWNTENLTHIDEIFYNCSSLKIIPDISKWNIKNVKYLRGMFERCSSLKTLPDISKWQIKNITDMSRMFKGCTSLISLPDISKLKDLFNVITIFDKNFFLKIFQRDKFVKPIKIILTGEKNVGCNSLAQISRGEELSDLYYPTHWDINKIDFFMKNKLIIINLCNGRDSYKNKMISSNKNTDIVIFVYDITKKSSFKSLDNRIAEVKEELNKFQGVIVGNKIDLIYEEKVTEDEGKEFAKKYNYKFYLASAKDNSKGFITFLEELVKDFINDKYKINLN